eukprot:7006589-Alexandrium_andersonii.AAC.1
MGVGYVHAADPQTRGWGVNRTSPIAKDLVSTRDLQEHRMMLPGSPPSCLRLRAQSQGKDVPYTEQNKCMPVFTIFAALSHTSTMNSCQGEVKASGCANEHA